MCLLPRNCIKAFRNPAKKRDAVGLALVVLEKEKTKFFLELLARVGLLPTSQKILPRISCASGSSPCSKPAFPRLA
jgi:hypothetical protein